MTEALPQIKGAYTYSVPLKDFTTIKVGGPAEIWAEFTDWADLQQFLQQRSPAVPLTLIGEGSNMIIRDGGITGVVSHLGRGFDNVLVEGETITAEAGATCGKVARAAREAGLEGLAFLCGIPGSVGGALKMNAGAYGTETYDYLVNVTVLTETGQEKVLEPADIPHGYRYSQLPEGWFFKAATWQLKPGDKQQIKAQMREINTRRRTSQPLEMPSSGSWFRNPVVNGEKVNAWKVVDAAGCRGLQVGGARVSDKHSNFFVNTGNATAQDFVTLSQQVEDRVKQSQGIELHKEVRFVGLR